MLIGYLVRERLTVFTSRYLSFTMPAVFLLIGCGLASLPRLRFTLPANRRASGITGVSGVIVGAAAVLILALAPWQPYDHRPSETDTAPLRDFMQAMSTRYRPGDDVLIDPQLACCDPVAWAYYQSLYFPLGAFAFVHVSDGAPAGKRVWYLARQGSETAAVRDSLQAGRVARAFWGPWYFTATLYEAPPLDPGIHFGDSIVYHGAQIDRRAELESGDTLSVTLWWSADRSPASDYSISLRLVDPNGLLVVQADSGPQSQNTPPQMSQWQPGTLYLDERSLTVPYYLKDGDYTLQLAVYRWQDGLRLPPAPGPNTTADHTLIIDHVHLRSFAGW